MGRQTGDSWRGQSLCYLLRNRSLFLTAIGRKWWWRTVSSRAMWSWQLEGQGLNMCFLSYAGCNNNIGHQENDLSGQLVKQAVVAQIGLALFASVLSVWDKSTCEPFCYLEKADTWMVNRRQPCLKNLILEIMIEARWY